MQVVIPHYGSDEMLGRCLASLRHEGGGPSDEEMPASQHVRPSERGQFTPIVIDSNPPNRRRYFTEAVNEGLTRALASFEGPVICILNNDTEVQPGWASAAERCFAEEPHVGIVGSRCLLMSKPDRMVWAGSKQCYPTGHHKTGLVSAGDLDVRTEEEWISFVSVFIKREVFRDIGLLDKNLRHTYSDADFCLRARLAGWKCYYEPKSSVLHAVGTSNRGGDSTLNQVMAKDARYFEKKWITGSLFADKLTRYRGQEFIGRKGKWQHPRNFQNRG